MSAMDMCNEGFFRLFLFGLVVCFEQLVGRPNGRTGSVTNASVNELLFERHDNSIDKLDITPHLRILGHVLLVALVNIVMVKYQILILFGL
mmetsp:Transcript_47425/g.57045  ORF Transcript_47425/g.57045 Transcript_47425/m.57045 type:complete len:91 (+) Transcript_47425:516-788(+)